MEILIAPNEQHAVSELRALRVKAQKTGLEIAAELRRWQNSLGHGKFKKNYLKAGWSENQVIHYLQYYPDGNSHPDVDNSKEVPPLSSEERDARELDALIQRMESLTIAVTQVRDDPERWSIPGNYAGVITAATTLRNALDSL